MHRLATIDIQNFRSCRAVAFELDDCTPIVGYNNAGKSNIIKAIEWALNPRPLAKQDFFDPTQPVTITAKITGLTDSMLDLLDARHRSKIEPYVNNGVIHLRRTQAEPGSSKKDILTQVFEPAGQLSDSQAWKPNPTGIPEAIKLLFPEPITIGAMEDAAEDSTKAKAGTTISQLLAEFTAPLEAAQGQEIQAVLDQVGQYLAADGTTRATELQRFDREASNALQLFFPGVQLHLDIPVPEVRSLFKGGTIRISEQGSGTIRDFTDLGHGAQRSIQMALIRYLCDLRVQGSHSAQRRLLLIEEPELFLHPQAIEQVRRALETLAEGGYQVIYATHSPMMISRRAIPRTRIVRKDALRGDTKVMASLADALSKRVTDEDNRLYMLLDLGNASGWLFSDRVLLAEGKTEQALLPQLYEAATGQSLADARMALVNLGGASAVPAAIEVFTELGIDACALVDFDFALTQAVKRSLIAEQDPDLQCCLGQLAAMAANDATITLNNKGRPTNNGNKKAVHVYREWAQGTAARPIAQALHNKLKPHRIWLWPGGDIEHHLGLSDCKQPAAWAGFLRDLEQQPLETLLADHATVQSFIAWLQTPPEDAAASS